MFWYSRLEVHCSTAPVCRKAKLEILAVFEWPHALCNVFPLTTIFILLPSFYWPVDQNVETTPYFNVETTKSVPDWSVFLFSSDLNQTNLYVYTCIIVREVFVQVLIWAIDDQIFAGNKDRYTILIAFFNHANQTRDPAHWLN